MKCRWVYCSATAFDREGGMFTEGVKRLKFVAGIALVCCGSMFGQTDFILRESAARIQVPVRTAFDVGIFTPVKSQDSGPVEAVRGIVAAFQDHPVVIIGEAHWLRQAGDFYIRLVQAPSFQERVQ